MEFTISSGQLLWIATAIVTLGAAWKALLPAFKLNTRVGVLETRQDRIFDILDKMREEARISDRLLVKAMVEIVDNRITGNNADNLKHTKNELMEFLRDN